MKQCHLIVWSVEKIQKVKNKMYKKKRKEKRRTMLLSRWEVCGSKNSRFIKDQKVEMLLDLISRTSLLGNILIY